MTGARSRFSLSDASRVVLVYAVFAALWILLSDKAVELVLADAQARILAGTLKGWLFVALTSVLLWVLLRRLAGRDEKSGAGPSLPPAAFPTLPAALFAVAVVILTGVSIVHNIAHHKHKEISRLRTITELKSEQVSAWLGERRADADFLRGSTYLAGLYARWRDAGDRASGEALASRLEHFRRAFAYAGILLLGRDGAPLSGPAGSAPPPLPPELLAAVRQAVDTAQTVAAGPYRDGADSLRLDLVAPLSAAGGRAGPVVVLRVDPMARLTPMLQDWAVPTGSGESLLVRRDGGNALFLNELRHRRDAAAKQRIPLAERRLLAAQALNGEARPGAVVEGVDYRGVPVVGVVQAVAGTDWRLIAKMDLDEVNAEGMRDARTIALAGVLALFITAVAALLFRQHQALLVEQRLRAGQDERLRDLQLLGAIADSSTDIIFAKDAEGRYLLFNRAAARAAGMGEADVLGRTDRDLFPADEAERVRADDRRIMAENRTATFEETLSLAGGTIVLQTTKGPLHDAEGRVTALFGISRDITADSRSQQALRDSQERLQLTLEATDDGLWDWDLRSGQAYLSPRYYEITGYRDGEVTPDLAFFRRTVHPDDWPAVWATMEAHLQGRTPFSEFDYRLLTASGEVKWMRGRGRVVARDATGAPQRMVGTVTEIGERKAAEATLRRQAEELARRNAELERFNRAMVGRELDMIALKRQVNELSRRLGGEPPHDLSRLDAAAPDGPDGTGKA